MADVIRVQTEKKMNTANLKGEHNKCKNLFTSLFVFVCVCVSLDICNYTWCEGNAWHRGGLFVFVFVSPQDICNYTWCEGHTWHRGGPAGQQGC